MMRASSLPPLSRLLFLAIALVALAVFVVGDTPPPASAQQTPTVLISNTGQTDTGAGYITGDYSLAQAFTTGAASGGYALGSIDIVVNATNITEAQRDAIRAELWSSSSGAPGSKLYNLTVPAHPISTGTVSFAAPANTTLAASTTYYAVFYTVGNFNMDLDATSADGEDSGGATGWSIANTAQFVNADVPTSTSTWTAGQGTSLFITVNAPGEAADPLDLASLTAESSTDNNTFAALTLSPEFDADTTGYTAVVDDDVTHVRLTPTLADTSSSVKVGKAGTTLNTVASGSASGSIALEVGDNEITVRVTDADSNTQDYTVSVRRGGIWFATLTPADLSVSGISYGTGCFTGADQTAVYCSNSATLNPSHLFSLGGEPEYRILGIRIFSGTLIVTLDRTPSAALKALNFCVGSNAFPMSGATSGTVINATTSLTFTVGTPVSLSIGTSCAQQATQSTNANLGGLTARGSATSTGTFAAFALSPATFNAATTSYTATVPNATAYAKLTPTVADTGKATVAVGPQSGTLAPVTDTQPSAALALSVGSNNAFTVRVTAEDGATTKDYTVTITREAPQGAFLVSNMDQTPGTFVSTDGIIYMQGFTTGSHSAGYTLASIEAVIEASSVSTTDRGTIRAELWSADTDGDPDAKVASLTVPASVATGTVSFAAPASTVLTASTKYFFTLYTTGSFDLKIDFTASDDEDTGSQAGWSISDSPHTSLTDTPSGATWTSVTGGNPEDTPAYRMRIKGAQAQSSTNANLSNLTASGSATSTGTFTAVTLSPATFNAATTSYTATVPNATAFAKLTPTVADTGKATVAVGPQNGNLAAVTDTQPSAALALATGANAFTVRVTAEDGATTKDYTVTITREAQQPTTPTVSLSATPNPVFEGRSLTVRATLSAPLSSSVTIPLSITDVTAEAGDHGTLANIVIASGATVGTGTIAINQDSDQDNESFTVALGTPLPTSVTAGSPSQLTITIRDDDGLPTVRLSIKPNPSPENTRVSIEAILSKPADGRVSIPIRLLWGRGVENGVVVNYGTLDQGDLPGMLGIPHFTELNGTKYTAYTFPIRIRISSRNQVSPSGIYNLAVRGDGATRGENFTVRLDTGHPDWPLGVGPGSPSSVKAEVEDPQPRQDGKRPRQGDDSRYFALSRLLVCWDDEASGDYAECDLASPASYGYRSLIDKSATHVKIRPTPTNSGAEVKVRKVTYQNDVRIATAWGSVSAVPSGGQSAAIEVDKTKINTYVDVRVTEGSVNYTYFLVIDPPLEESLTYTLSPQARAVEGESALLTLTLGQAAPAGGAEFTVTASHPAFGAAADDLGAITSPVLVPEGETSLAIAVPTVDDAIDEDDETFTVTVAPAASGWKAAGVGKDTALVTIQDDDTAGVTVSAASPLSVAEGGSASYTVVLDSRPTADVTVTPTSDDPGAATVSPASHVFTPSGWNTAATFTVSGVADTDTSDESVGIRHGVASGDARYGAVIVSTVPVRVSETTTPGQENQEQGPQEKHADLIARMKEWRNDPRYVHDKAHTDRWDRALLAFGETVADTSLTAMTAAEAQTYADRGWTRWVEVAAALRELENQAPTVASGIGDATIVNESGTSQVSLSGVFDDADGDSLTVTAASSDETKATVSVASDYSSLTVTAKGRGTASITVTANDGNGGTVSDAFTVTVKAAPVVASSIADVSGLEAGAKQEVSLSGVFSDADGDALTITAASSDETKATVTVAADQSNLTLTGVAEGSATITVTARDPDGNTVSDAFDVSVAAAQQQQQQDPSPNQAPTVASAISDVTIVDESGTKQVSLSGVFDDGDGDSLTLTAASSDATKATVSVASDYSNLTVSAKARGTATITVTANDGNGGTVDDTFTVKVKATPVVASSIGDVSGLEAGATQEVSLSGVFSDADGDSLTITAASSGDAIATVTVAADQSTLTLAGVAEGAATITVTARDPDGNTVSDDFTVSVVPEPEEEEPEGETSDGSPTVANPLADIGLEGPPGWEHISLSGVFHDPDGDELTITVVSSDHGVASMYESVYEEGSTLTVLAMGTGTATITVTAEDPDGNTVSDQFQVTVTPASQEG